MGPKKGYLNQLHSSGKQKMVFDLTIIHDKLCTILGSVCRLYTISVSIRKWPEFLALKENQVYYLCEIYNLA